VHNFWEYEPILWYILCQYKLLNLTDTIQSDFQMTKSTSNLS